MSVDEVKQLKSRVIKVQTERQKDTKRYSGKAGNTNKYYR